MRKRFIKSPSQFEIEIEAVVEEFLDWKDVYASKIPDGHVGVVIFAANEEGDVAIDWRLEIKGIKLKTKSFFDKGEAMGMKGQVIWIDES
jgi:hypothetical protein